MTSSNIFQVEQVRAEQIKEGDRLWLAAKYCLPGWQAVRNVAPVKGFVGFECAAGALAIQARGIVLRRVAPVSPEITEALEDLVGWIDNDLDLSDRYAVEGAAPDELVGCTRPVECWRRGDVVIEHARAVLLSRENGDR